MPLKAQSLHGPRTGQATRRSSFSGSTRERALWRPQIWDRSCLRVLRAAATAAGLEAGRVDSRTLRRSRGQEIILIERKAGKSERGILEIAAAFLRDSPATIERHYARLLPKDAGQSQHGEHRLEP